MVTAMLIGDGAQVEVRSAAAGCARWWYSARDQWRAWPRDRTVVLKAVSGVPGEACNIGVVSFAGPSVKGPRLRRSMLVWQ